MGTGQQYFTISGEVTNVGDLQRATWLIPTGGLQGVFITVVQNPKLAAVQLGNNPTNQVGNYQY